MHQAMYRAHALQRRPGTWMRNYIIPTIGRIVACALGIGIGYLIAHM